MTAALPSPAHGLSGRAHYLPIGIGASVVQALLMVPGYNNDDGFDSAWFAMAALSLVVTVAVFALAVPNGGGTTAIVLAVLAAFGAVAFWMMLSLPLAAGATVVGLRARHEAAERTQATIGLALAAVAAVATVAFIIGDMFAD